MNEETIEELHAKLTALESETADLRLDYLVTSRRYDEAQVSLKKLTALSLTAATRAAVAVEKAVLATRKAASVAEQLAPHVSGAENLAAQRAGQAVATSADAAAASAEAAVEAAAAAAAAAAIAIHTAELEPEKNELAAAAATANEAAAGGKRAIESALQAVKIAKAVAEFMNPSNRSSIGQQPSMS